MRVAYRNVARNGPQTGSRALYRKLMLLRLVGRGKRVPNVARARSNVARMSVNTVSNIPGISMLGEPFHMGNSGLVSFGEPPISGPEDLQPGVASRVLWQPRELKDLKAWSGLSMTNSARATAGQFPGPARRRAA